MKLNIYNFCRNNDTNKFNTYSIYTLLTGNCDMLFTKQNWLNELTIMVR